MAQLNGVDRITIERDRQIYEEGWDPTHDDEHAAHQLALAAACYAAPEPIFKGVVNKRVVKLEDAWPWDSEWWKPSDLVRVWQPEALHIRLNKNAETRADRIRELEKAGALIAAEIDRLLRIHAV